MFNFFKVFYDQTINKWKNIYNKKEKERHLKCEFKSQKFSGAMSSNEMTNDLGVSAWIKIKNGKKILLEQTKNKNINQN